MANVRVVLICLWLFGCAMATTDKPSDLSPPKDLEHAMERLEAMCEQLDKHLLGKPQGDLAWAATQLEHGAAQMRLGYGAFEDKSIPGFARMARDAESWMLQVALEARQGHGDIARDLYRTGYEKHCNECHEAEARAR